LLDFIGSREYENIPRYMKADLYASEYRDQRLQAVAPESFAKAVRACADGYLYNVLGTPRSVQAAEESHGRLWLTIYFDESGKDIQNYHDATHVYQVGLELGGEKRLYVLKMKRASESISAYGVVTTPDDVERALGFVRDFLTHGFLNQKTGSFGTDAAGHNNGS
ncbi:MAG: hypothetical protein HYS45_00335, partial [Parcubacteria group bacterium]|nr:hypothetical protein [Parcubacteria group bacterium]